MNNIDSFRNCGTPKEVEESKTQRNLPELTTKQKPRVEIQQNAAAAALATPPLIAASPSLSSASKSVTSTPFAMDFPVPTYTTTQLLSKKTEWLNQMNLFDTNKDMSCFDFDYSVRLINNIRFANGGDDTFCLCLCNMFEHNCNSCKKTNTKTYKNDRVFGPGNFLVPITPLSPTKNKWTPQIKFNHPAIKSQLTTGSCDYLYKQLKQMIIFLQLYGGATLNIKARQHQKSLNPSKISIHSFIQAKKGLVSFGLDSSYYINEWAPKLVSGFLERLGGADKMIEATSIFFSDTMITTALKLLKQTGFNESSCSIPTSLPASIPASMPASSLMSMSRDAYVDSVSKNELQSDALTIGENSLLVFDVAEMETDDFIVGLNTVVFDDGAMQFDALTIERNSVDIAVAASRLILENNNVVIGHEILDEKLDVADEICMSTGALHLVLTTDDIDILQLLAEDTDTTLPSDTKTQRFIKNYNECFSKTRKETNYSVIQSDLAIANELMYYLTHHSFPGSRGVVHSSDVGFWRFKKKKNIGMDIESF